MDGNKPEAATKPPPTSPTPSAAAEIRGLKGVSKVGRYEIVRELDRGGMAVIYLGWDPYIKRNVAIKISHPATDKARERFFVEAQSVGRLSHPNVVALYDAGVYGKFCYMAMEFMEGGSLAAFCTPDKLLPARHVVEDIIAVANALDYMHKRGMIHRDVKPANILLDSEGVPKVTDFGITLDVDQTVDSGFCGTVRYMSPEQVRDEGLSQNTYIFSLGGVLYELLTGKKAFPGNNQAAVVHRILEEEPEPLETLRPDLPRALAEVVRKALEKDPKARYQNCMEMAYELQVVLRALTHQAPADHERAKDVVEYVLNVPFFNNFKRDQVEKLLASSHIQKAAAGDVVVAEGEVDDTFYVVLSGCLNIIRDGVEVAKVSVGECFGEMAYIGRQPRIATVTADTECVLIKISAALLERAPGPIQLRFYKNFANFLVQRLSNHLKGREGKMPAKE